MNSSDMPPARVEACSRQAETDHARRWQRVMDCVALKTPDRMPVGLLMNFWLARYGGISYHRQMYDYDKVAEIAESLCREFEPDFFTSPYTMTTFGPMLEAIDFRQLEWPGHGVGDDQPYQYLDREYMTADEYDDFIFDPTGFYLGRYLPRVAGAYAGLEPLASLGGSAYLGVGFATLAFGDPRVRHAFDRLESASRVVHDLLMHEIDFGRRLATLGVPLGFGLIASAPYDAMADFFRGATGMMKDLYRRADTVLEALDKMATLIVRRTLAQAKFVRNPLVFIPVHWAPDPFMSQRQFETFWWPSFKKMACAFIEGGLVPMPLWESDCTRRLETLRELPPGTCIHWFEKTPLLRAFEVLGDVSALRGGLSASLLTTGNPDEIDIAVRQLAENVFHKGGKLIFDSGFGIPDETPVDNVRAMFAAARRYGT